MATSTDSKVAALRENLRELDAQRASLEAQLRALLHEPNAPNSPAPASGRALSPDEKVALFRHLFAGRQDVFAVRWENRKDGRSGYAPACSNEWVAGICGKPKIKCGACPNQAFVAFSDATVRNHLRGPKQNGKIADYVMGVYPLLRDNRCWFLAADFDGDHWFDDALAFVQTCRAHRIPCALERSRSGRGGHVWIFFAEPIEAREARQLGTAIMTETMELRPEIGFKSYDRFFPNQDEMPAGGFGNLIALPLARRSREQDNSVFIDDDLQPHPDQWAFLASLQRLSRDDVRAIVRDAQESGRVLGVRMPLDEDEYGEPWLLAPSRQSKPGPIAARLPEAVQVVLADGVYIERVDLPSEMVTRLNRLAAFQNPEFYRAQAMRLPVYDKPRIISCAELEQRHIALPRGCFEEAIELLGANQVRAVVEDRRELGTALDVRFIGNLKPEQQRALDAVVEHDFGVLAAGTAFGKTVVAAAAIANRGRNALVLVHRRELLVQWVERLKTFLSVAADDVGTIGGGRRKPTGRIDVALIQSLVRNGQVSDAVGGYGHLLVDECHHISAASFELVARRSKARFVLGLSATVARKDGHHPIIFMQCGPIRHRVDPRAQAAQRTFEHFVDVRRTAFRLPPELQTPGTSIPAVFGALCKDEQRNTTIVDDVLAALEAGRNPLVLTERRDHLDDLASRFKGAARNITILRGGMKAADRRAAEASLRVPDSDERLILATGTYDVADEKDCARIRAALRDLGVTWKIPYKTDADRYAGRYARHGVPVSKRYE